VKARGPGQVDLPLAAAAERLRRPPGRPRTALGVKSVQAQQASALRLGIHKSATSAATVPGLCPLVPRLLDLATAASYLGVSSWTLRDLEAAGRLARVRLPLPEGRELRKVLFDREDLDRLVDHSKEDPSEPPPCSARISEV